MGKINGCLKCLFIFFNVLFAILGGLMIIWAIQFSAISHQLPEVSGWIWGSAISVFGISCLGIYAACSEKEIILKIFAGFMVVGMIIMLTFGIITVVKRNKVKSSFDSTESTEKDEKIRMLLNELLEFAMGLCFGFAAIALLGLLISLLMIHQVRRHDGSEGSSIAMRVY